MNFRRIIQTQVSPSPSKATVDPPSGTPLKSPLEEKLNTPSADGDCAVNLHDPSVGSNPLPVIVPVPVMMRKSAFCRTTTDPSRSKVKPPTLQRPGVGVDGVKI